MTVITIISITSYIVGRRKAIKVNIKDNLGSLSLSPIFFFNLLLTDALLTSLCNNYLCTKIAEWNRDGDSQHSSR